MEKKDGRNNKESNFIVKIVATVFSWKMYHITADEMNQNNLLKYQLLKDFQR